MTVKRGKAKLFRSNYSSTDNKTIYSWEDLIQIYMFAKESENLSKGSLNNKRESIKLLFKFFEVYEYELKPHELDTNICREFVNYLKKDHIKFENNHCVKKKDKTIGLSISTINSNLKHLKSMFNFWVSEGYLESNPFKKVRQISEPIDTVESITMEQVAKLLKQPDRRTFAGFRDYVLITLLVDTGLRISEAINLKFSDIDFKSNTIQIRPEIAKSRRVRYVPFSYKTNRLLRELRSEVEELGTPYMFVTVYGNQLDRARIRQRMRKYGEQAGLVGIKISPHVLRHTFAKYYLLNNGDLMTLQKILGHSSLKMVRRYIQMTDRDMSSQHNKFSPLNNI